jgi:hypothetical protein
MKSCPKCNRTFPDEGQKFCTFDGGLLIAPQTFDPNATIRATSIDLNAASERPTSRDLPDPNATIIDNSATVALPRNTGPTTGPTSTAPNTADVSRPAPPPPPPPPVIPPPPPVTAAPPPPPVEQPPARTTGEVVAPQPPVSPAPVPSAPLPAAPAPSAPLPPPVAKKKSKLPWIIAGVLIFLLLGGAALAGLFFFVIKPRLDEMAAQRNPPSRQVEDTNANVSTPTPVPSVATSTPTPEDTFQPPPNTTQFVNSNAKLDGKLAEHYFDFSFYYPNSWNRDPKAGVAGATNFVKVERKLSPALIQENFAVGWYTSAGTFVGDLGSYPQRVQELSQSLAKNVAEYKLVTERPTKVNSMDAYEFLWEGVAKDTERGDLKLWGRIIFLPTGNEGDTAGATLTMLCTSLAPGLSSVEDVGKHGESSVILDSFRFGKKQ